MAGNARRDARGGNLTITADTLVVSNNGDLKLDTSNTAQGGVLLINASSLLVEDLANITTDAFAESQGAELIINADTVTVSGGEITAQTTDGSGSGMTLNVADSLLIREDGALATESFGSGPGSDITVNAQSVTLQSGGQIDSSALNSGRGGNVVLQVAETVTVSGASENRRSEISAQSGDLDRESILGDVPGYGTGEGGSIFVGANQILIDQEGRISSQGIREGNAGTISLVANRLDIDSAGIETSAPQAAGGNVDIRVRDFIGVVNGRVTASAGGVTPGDDGGNIFIDPELLFLDQATISANANAGNGGNITIIAASILRSPKTTIEASSRQGIDGDITIDGVVNEVTALETLAVEFDDVASLLSQRCTIAQLAERSSFVVQTATSASGQSVGFRMAPLASTDSGGGEEGLVAFSEALTLLAPGSDPSFHGFDLVECP